jgi:hypothetical protein
VLEWGYIQLRWFCKTSCYTESLGVGHFVAI